MQVNVGSIDRVLRIGAGSVLIFLAILGFIGIWGFLGVILLVTGTTRFCPAYRLLGMSTCSIKKS